jgi:hypothetical protein
MNSTESSLNPTPRVYAKMYASDFSEPVVAALAKAKGKGAPVFDDNCKSCKSIFTVRAFTVLTQYKKYGRFIPPAFCRACFDVARGVAVPPPPGNAVIRKKETVVHVPPELSAKELAVFRKRWENKEVLVKFKKAVSFSTSDESETPEKGRIVAISKNAITLKADDEEVHQARTYSLSDVEGLQALKRYIDKMVAASVDEAVQRAVTGQPATASAPPFQAVA